MNEGLETNMESTIEKPMKTTKFPNELYRKLFLMGVVLVGLVVNVFIIDRVVKFSSKAQTTEVDLYFLPNQTRLPFQESFVLMLDPKSASISFVRVVIAFNPTQVQLSGEVSTATSPLKRLFPITTAQQANSSGRIEIVLVLSPGMAAPTAAFPIAILPMKSVAGAQATEITIVDEEVQIVDTSARELAFVSGFVTLATDSGFRMTTADAPGGLGACTEGYFDTAIGCIPISDPQAFAEFILGWGIGIAGGIAFILIVYSGFMIMISQGNPQRLQAGKELLTAAVMGLSLLVFGAFILRLIGVDILGIPGLG